MIFYYLCNTQTKRDMKRALILLAAIVSLASCNRWIIPDSSNKYLSPIKASGNVTRVKARIVDEIRVEAVKQDTMICKVSNGKATITTITFEGVTIPAKSKGKIVEENGAYYFVFNDKDISKKVGRLPLNIDKETIFIRTVDKVMVGTRLKVDTNQPGFELRIEEENETQSIAAK